MFFYNVLYKVLMWEDHTALYLMSNIYGINWFCFFVIIFKRK